MDGASRLLNVSDIQYGCTHDGPGIRTVVFLKGCPLHCKWCHNPETVRTENEVFFRKKKCIGCMRCVSACPHGAHTEQRGEHRFDKERCRGCMKCADVCPLCAIAPVSQWRSVEYVLERVKQDVAFYRGKGGLTVSGGEPTMQLEAVTVLLKMAKEERISTCVETCGAFSPSKTASLAEYTDLFLYDIKDTDADRLFRNTGGTLSLIVENLRRLDALGKESVMRCVLIPDVNISRSHATAVAELFEGLQNCRYVELLPYHPLGISKSEQLGVRATRYRDIRSEEVEAFAKQLTDRGVATKLNGTLYK